MQDTMFVNQKEYAVRSLLGRGKGGYSYLVERDGALYVLKQIHHEPCDYYTFGNKLESERLDYTRLRAAGIRIPEMLDIDFSNERILKTYIHGPSVYELVRDDALQTEHLRQVRQMAAIARAAGLNIDYFPTNFILQDGVLFYIDYECNPYSEEWNFENWGILYWSKTEAFLSYAREHG